MTSELKEALEEIERLRDLNQMYVHRWLEAVNLLEQNLDLLTCSYLHIRQVGESCSSARSRMQGAPFPGCSVCRARDLADNGGVLGLPREQRKDKP